VYATGLRWTGPSGGVWAELDATMGQFGWTLVEGPGFGINGPVLIDPQTLASMLMIHIHYLGQTKEDNKVVYECMTQKEQLVGTFVKRFAKQCNLNPKLVMLTKGLPAKQPNGTGMSLPADYIRGEDLLSPDRTLASYDALSDEPTLYLIYTGYWEDFRPQ